MFHHEYSLKFGEAVYQSVYQSSSVLDANKLTNLRWVLPHKLALGLIEELYATYEIEVSVPRL